MLKISVSGVVCSICFLLFEIVGRLLYPYGDEPDWGVRVDDLISGNHSWLNPYRWFEGVLKNYHSYILCDITASPFSLFATINPLNCSESQESIVIRLSITAVVCAPLILFACTAQKNNHKGNKGIFNYENQRVDALALALLVPVVTYSLGVLAEEQLTLVLSLLIIVADRRWLSTIILLAVILSIDFGNGIVVVATVIALNSYRYIARFVTVKTVAIIAFLQSIAATMLGIAFLEFLTNISFLAAKANSIVFSLNTNGLADKYPVYLRPAVTFMTGVFMTPSFVKVIPAFLLVAIALMIVVWRLLGLVRTIKEDSYEFHKDIRERIVDCCAVTTMVLTFVLIMPTYGNAKYYLFVIPFLMRASLLVMGKKQIMVLLVLSQLTVFSGLLLYRL